MTGYFFVGGPREGTVELDRPLPIIQLRVWDGPLTVCAPSFVDAELVAPVSTVVYRREKLHFSAEPGDEYIFYVLDSEPTSSAIRKVFRLAAMCVDWQIGK